MRINQAGLDLIKNFEGCELKAYKDIVGHITVGYGHMDDNMAIDTVITQEQADELLMQDLERFQVGVEKLLTRKVNENMFSALVSFAYNLGLGNLKMSLLLRCVNKGNFPDAAMQFERWTRASGQVIPGLVRRRHAERDLFLS